MRKPRTRKDLEADPRVRDLDKSGDIWDCFLKAGYAFDGERQISLGTIKSLCDDMDTVVEVPCVDGRNVYTL